MISLRKTAVLCLICLSFFSGAVWADGPCNPLIRIKLARYFPVGTPQVVITSDQPFTVTDQTGASVVQAPTGTSYDFSDEAGAKVSISGAGSGTDSEESESGTTVDSPFFTVQPCPGGVVTIALSNPDAAPRHYRGSILILPGLSIVNTLPLEDYIKGVLMPEIGASAPVEALKAQAIAARTYTVRNLNKMSVVGADMDDTTRTQQYIGVDGETPAIVEAVADTAGQVLLYNGAPIDAVYSTDCGGMTAVGTANEPYLAPVQDPECAQETPWEVDLTPVQVAKLAGTDPPSAPELVNLQITQTDASGRVTNVRISAGGVESQLTGNALRKLLGYDLLKSTLFKISRGADGNFHLVGQGWGHGLGMCQRGAIYLARHSSLYNDILMHYYTGAKVAQLDPAMLGTAPGSQLAGPTAAASTPLVP